MLQDKEIVRHTCCSECGWKGCRDELVETRYETDIKELEENFKSSIEELSESYNIINGFAQGIGCPNCGVTFYCKYFPEIPRLIKTKYEKQQELIENIK